MRRCLFIMLVLALTNCAAAELQEKLEKRAAAEKQYQDAKSDCDQKFPPPGIPKSAGARAQCVNDAVSLLMPTARYPDVFQLFMAQNLDIAEQVQSGHLTPIQGNAAVAEKWSQAMAENQRRGVALVGALAQTQAAAAASSQAAASWRATGPRTCNYGNGTVTCY
jgi:hypothetical protein